MEKHREAQLRQMLDQVLLVGCGAVRWDELYLWLGVRRMTKGPWRVIRDMWVDLCQEQGHSKPIKLRLVTPDSPAQSMAIFRREQAPGEKFDDVSILAE